MKTGIELISKEREKQVSKGRDSHHDILVNGKSQLSEVAQLLLETDVDLIDLQNRMLKYKDLDWIIEDWSDEVIEDLLKRPYFERVKIAGALCAAEIDRLLALEINQ